MNKSNSVIDIHDVHKSFSGTEVLRGVSLSAETGDVICILGSSGSGKSTLLRCINYLEMPDRGEIIVCGNQVRMKHKRGKPRPVSNKEVIALRRQIGMVFQNFNLWDHMTALENIIEAPVNVLKIPKKKAIASANLLLEKVGLFDRGNSYPSQLSGGQQQRIAIARALAIDPQVLLFDEPTSALDPELVGEVLRVIRDLAEEGRTMLIVTHEIGFAREVANQVIFLHDGRVEEQGPPEKVIDNPDSENCRAFLSMDLDQV
jgi:ABC-type histidine transport system ATPase subunit